MLPHSVSRQLVVIDAGLIDHYQTIFKDPYLLFEPDPKGQIPICEAGINNNIL